MHELDPTFRDWPRGDAAARDVARWRKAERERLILARRSLDVATRRAIAARIAEGLDAGFGEIAGRRSGATGRSVASLICGPGLGRWSTGRDLRPPGRGREGQPLEFHRWRPGEQLVPGHWNIPVPAEPVPVEPDLVFAPLVGFDAGCYRLGYGGGFFDRTLAGLRGRVQAVGIGYASSRLATIFPQWHDVPMDLLVTEEGVSHRAGA